MKIKTKKCPEKFLRTLCHAISRIYFAEPERFDLLPLANVFAARLFVDDEVVLPEDFRVLLDLAVPEALRLVLLLAELPDLEVPDFAELADAVTLFFVALPDFRESLFDELADLHLVLFAEAPDLPAVLFVEPAPVDLLPPVRDAAVELFAADFVVDFLAPDVLRELLPLVFFDDDDLVPPDFPELDFDDRVVEGPAPPDCEPPVFDELSLPTTLSAAAPSASTAAPVAAPPSMSLATSITFFMIVSVVPRDRERFDDFEPDDEPDRLPDFEVLFCLPLIPPEDR